MVANGAAMLGRRLPPDLLRVLALACFSGVFLSTSGAFDTEAAALLPRLGYWLMIALITTAALQSCHRILRRRDTAAPEWRLRLVGLLLLFLPLTLVAMVGCKILFGGVPNMTAFRHLLPGMTSISVALQLVLAFFPIRPIAQVAAPEPASPPAASEQLIEFLPLPLRGARLDALEAEDHYVRVHTSAGHALVRMRFRDAVAAVSGRRGLRPHRSWWVAEQSVVALRRADGRTTLTLAAGQQVPVSRTVAQTLGPNFGRTSS